MDDRYPTDEELKQIREWQCLKYEDFVALAEFVAAIWNYGEPWVKLTGKRVKTLRLATGGWSGNESIIDALEHNLMFPMVCWQKSERGGLHVYKIPALHS